MKRFSSLFLVALLSGGIILGAYKLFFEKTTTSTKGVTTFFSLPVVNYHNVGLTAEAPDFTQAAELALHSVVRQLARASCSYQNFHYYANRAKQLTK